MVLISLLLLQDRPALSPHVLADTHGPAAIFCPAASNPSDAEHEGPRLWVPLQLVHCTAAVGSLGNEKPI